MPNIESVRTLIILCLLLYPADHVLSQSSNETEYQRIIKEGIIEYNAAHFDEARRLFEEAHAIKPSARTLRGIGMVAFGARNYVKAIEALEESLVDKRHPLTDKMREHATTLLKKAKLYIASYTLYIEPAGTELKLTLDGNLANLPVDGILRVNPGKHQLIISATGYETEIRQIDAVSGMSREIKVQLVPIGTPNGDGMAHPVEGADGQQIPNERATVGEDTADTTSIYGTLGWIGASVSALSLGGGIAALVVRNNKADEWYGESCDAGSSANERCIDLENAVREAETFIVLGFTAAGIFAGAAVVFFILDSEQSAQQQAMGCNIGTGMKGISCQIRF